MRNEYICQIKSMDLTFFSFFFVHFIFCRDGSIGPYFVAILGDKYGYRPIPSKFTMTHFLKVVSYLEKEETSESLEAVTLIKEWYIKDTNALGGSVWFICQEN